MSRGRRVFAIGLVAAATVPVVWILTRPGGAPLTAERLAEAKDLWRKRGPRSYDVDVELPGARHHVEVRDGVVTKMTTDGNDVPDRVWAQWSVEGMLGFLSEELSNLARPESAFGVADPSDVTLRADLSPENGFPFRFLRHVHGQKRSFEWKARLTPR